MDTYEKKYNEAFEKAKKEYKGAVGSHCDVAEAVVNILQGIFPELCESEDERIRKEIIEYLKGDLDDITTDDTDRWINWIEKQKDCILVPKSHIDPIGEPGVDGMEILEKQKESLHISETYKENPDSFTYVPENAETGTQEQKPVDPSDDELQRHQDELTEFKKFATKQAKENQLHISYTRDVMWENFCSELLSFVSSRKPAEWSEEDEAMLGNILGTYKLIEDMLDLSRDVLESMKLEKDWLIKRFKSLRPQPKQEWSEEDKRMLNTIISEFEAMSNNCETVLEKNLCAEKVTWLKSLRPRQNSIVAVDAEQLLKILPKRQVRSEEDEKVLSQAIETLEHENYLILADKLKSLRPSYKVIDEKRLKEYLPPQWKPSEEQMEYLNDAIDCYREEDNDDAVDVLKELRKELKKLM